jgi:hypothetical protein
MELAWLRGESDDEQEFDEFKERRRRFTISRLPFGDSGVRSQGSRGERANDERSALVEGFEQRLRSSPWLRKTPKVSRRESRFAAAMLGFLLAFASAVSALLLARPT